MEILIGLAVVVGFIAVVYFARKKSDSSAATPPGPEIGVPEQGSPNVRPPAIEDAGIHEIR